MLNRTPLAIMAAAATLLPPALATFDASANTNMAVYWGQGPSQQPLRFFCNDDNIDIIPIGFVNVFPDQSGGYPGTNFGNQCGSATYKNINGSSSLLLSSCPDIGPDITYCQGKGKKVLLSLGGAIPNNQHLDSEASAVEFATFLWDAFGPEDTSKTTPRPFGSAVVDGFDFDIENVLASGENPGDLDRGYGTMVNTLRTLYATDQSKPYYISAAPQCVVPDAHLAAAIETSPFDFLFIQFYNTPQCSARAYFDHSYGGTNTNISFANWVDFVQGQSYNPNTKVYLGLPAAADTDDVYDVDMYLQPEEAHEIIKALQCAYQHQFGGVMLYEATSSQNNQINGQPYADVLKGYLENTGCTVSPVTSSATPQSTTAVSSTIAATTTPAVSTTPSVTTTPAVSTTPSASSTISAISSTAASSTQAASSSVGVPSSSSTKTTASSSQTASSSVGIPSSGSTKATASSSQTASSSVGVPSSSSTKATASSSQTASSSVGIPSSSSTKATASSSQAASSSVAVPSSSPTKATASSSQTALSSVGVPSSGSTTAAVIFTPTSSGQIPGSVSGTGSSLSTLISGSSIPTSSSGVAVQPTTSAAASLSVSVSTPANGPSSLSTSAITSSRPASLGQGGATTSASPFTSASGSIPYSIGISGSGRPSYSPSVNGSIRLPSTSLSRSPYLNVTSPTLSYAAASAVTSSNSSPILSGTAVSSGVQSTETTSLTTYTTVTSCPVTTTKVQGGVTSIVVQTSLITSTVTTCPRCSEKTQSASTPGLASSTPGSPGRFGTTTPPSVPSVSALPLQSSVLQSSPSVALAGQSSGPLPSPTTYTTTQIVSTLITTCSQATTFSLSPSGKIYTATVNETLTITEGCPCTLTHTTTGYSVPTNYGSPSQPQGPPGNAYTFPTGTSTFVIVGATNAASQAGAAGSNGSPYASSGSTSKGSESSPGGSNGSSSAGSPSAPNTGSQSNPNVSNGAAVPSVGAPGVSNTGSQSNSNVQSGASAPESGNKAAAAQQSSPQQSSPQQSSPQQSSPQQSPPQQSSPQQSSPQQSPAQGSPSEAGAAGSGSTAGASGVTGSHVPVVTMEIIPVPQSPTQTSTSVVTGAHVPIVTMKIIPVPLSPSQIAQSGSINQNGISNGQSSGQSSGQASGQASGQSSGQSSGSSNGQGSGQSGTASGQPIGQQKEQQSGQQSGSGLFPINNGTAPVKPSGTVSANPSITGSAGQGAGSGSNSAQPSPMQFKGAASRVGGSLLGLIAASAAAVLLL